MPTAPFWFDVCCIQKWEVSGDLPWRSTTTALCLPRLELMSWASKPWENAGPAACDPIDVAMARLNGDTLQLGLLLSSNPTAGAAESQERC